MRPSSATATVIDGVDVLLHPSAIQTAPRMSSLRNHLDTYLQDVLTVPASLAGLPAISIPAERGRDTWPVGVSAVAQWGCEGVLFDIGRAIQQI